MQQQLANSKQSMQYFTHSIGEERGFEPFYQLLLLKRKVTESTVAIDLAAWQTSDQLSCNFENIGGMTPPYSHYQIPVCIQTVLA